MGGMPSGPLINRGHSATDASSWLCHLRGTMVPQKGLLNFSKFLSSEQSKQGAEMQVSREQNERGRRTRVGLERASKASNEADKNGGGHFPMHRRKRSVVCRCCLPQVDVVC